MGKGLLYKAVFPEEKFLLSDPIIQIEWIFKRHLNKDDDNSSLDGCREDEMSVCKTLWLVSGTE